MKLLDFQFDGNYWILDFSWNHALLIYLSFWRNSRKQNFEFAADFIIFQVFLKALNDICRHILLVEIWLKWVTNPNKITLIQALSTSLKAWKMLFWTWTLSPKPIKKRLRPPATTTPSWSGPWITRTISEHSSKKKLLQTLFHNFLTKVFCLKVCWSFWSCNVC